MKRTAMTAVGVVAMLAGASGAWSQPATPTAPTAPAARPAPTLKLGDKAPALSIAEWVKGEPVTGFEPGRVYVVEFWATWCGPCIASIPHLTELQQSFADKGVTIIGVTTEDPRNALDTVKTFVQEKGELIGYRIAFDKGKDTAGAFMRAAGQSGIPTAFVVDKAGAIAYIGHPMELDLVLERVVAGTWEPEAGRAELVQIGKLRNTIVNQARTDAPGALKTLEAFSTKYPHAAKGMQSFRFMLLAKTGDTAGAGALGRELVDQWAKQKNDGALNALAWDIVRPDTEFKSQDLELALRAVEAADRLTGGKDPATLDTLARVQFLKGDVDAAIKTQTRAVELAEEPAMKGELQKTLDEYTKGKK